MAGEEVGRRDDTLPAGRRLEVPNVRERRAHVALAREHGVETERNIATAEHEALVEPAELLEQRTPYGDAGASDREDVAVPRRGPEQRRRVGPHPLEEVVGEAVHAEHDAAVLDLAVGPDQLGADQPDLGAHRPAHHLSHPPRIGHLGVVVEEEQDFTTRRARRPRC